MVHLRTRVYLVFICFDTLSAYINNNGQLEYVILNTFVYNLKNNVIFSLQLSTSDIAYILNKSLSQALRMANSGYLSIIISEGACFCIQVKQTCGCKQHNAPHQISKHTNTLDLSRTDTHSLGGSPTVHD